MNQASPIAAPAPALFLTPTELLANYPEARLQTSQPKTARRHRPSPQQGIALEILGHAIEYLIDTNFYHQRADDPAVKEAVAILKQSSRDVFAAAPEMVPAGARAARWLRSHLHSRTPSSSVTQPTGPARLILVKR